MLRFVFQVRNIQKKMQSLEGQFDTCTEQLFEVTLKLEVKEKNLANAEGESGSLSRRVLLIEEEVERSEERLARAITDLAKHSQRADCAIKMRQQLENNNSYNEEQCDKLETQLKEDKFTMAESERKYEDIARKLATMEGELERSNERCTMGEKKIIDLEEELKVNENTMLNKYNANFIVVSFLRLSDRICSSSKCLKKRHFRGKRIIKTKFAI